MARFQVQQANRVGRAVQLLLLGMLFLPALAVTPARARSEIVAAYDKVALAFSLKYVDGIISVRNIGYRGFDVDGEKIDLSVEPARYEMLFQPAISASLKTTVEDFQLVDNEHARCRVAQELSVVKVDKERNRRYTTTIDSQSNDEWVHTPDGWRLQSSRVLKQNYRRGAPSTP